MRTSVVKNSIHIFGPEHQTDLLLLLNFILKSISTGSPINVSPQMILFSKNCLLLTDKPRVTGGRKTRGVGVMKDGVIKVEEKIHTP